MDILLVNDDGHKSEGINLLFDKLVEIGHDCVIVAPNKNQSGMGSGVRGNGSNTILERYGKNKYKCTGTPVTCVNIAFSGFKKFDLVISGINEGHNAGDTIFLSGTVNAARQGAMYKVPAIAVSTKRNEDRSVNFDKTVDFLAKNLDKLVKLCEPDTIININTCSNFDNVLMTIPYKRDRIIDQYDKKDRGNGKYEFVYNGKDEYEFVNDVETDLGAITMNNASISIINTYMDSKYDMKTLREKFKLT